MDLNKVKFSVLLPILERDDIVIGLPKAIKSLSTRRLLTMTRISGLKVSQPFY